ncbi:MAG TPA: hypothetical protein VIV40_02910 [Kofleriaceae bacterium]
MPRIALVVLGVLGGCSFEANYADGFYPCSASDNKCPEGLVCRKNLDDALVCLAPRMDASIDGQPGDGGGVDAPSYSLNCAKPYQFPVDGGTFEDSTALRNNKSQTQCFNRTMGGPDAIHTITPGAGRMMFVRIEAPFAATAYVISGCPQSACNGNTYATPGNDIGVYTLAGPHYIVVDSLAANVSGPYKLTLSF